MRSIAMRNISFYDSWLRTFLYNDFFLFFFLCCNCWWFLLFRLWPSWNCNHCNKIWTITLNLRIWIYFLATVNITFIFIFWTHQTIATWHLTDSSIVCFPSLLIQWCKMVAAARYHGEFLMPLLDWGTIIPLPESKPPWDRPVTAKKLSHGTHAASLGLGMS